MAQWVCVISPTLFDAWVSYFCSDNETVWPKLCPLSKYKSTWSIFHAIVILLNIFLIIWWIDIIVGIMDQCNTSDLPYQVYVGQWPIFYVPASLLHILKNYLIEQCCTWNNGSVTLKDWPCKIYVGQWPMFHDPFILPYIIVIDRNYFYS